MEKIDQVELPNKLYFRIGEVAKILGVKPYVLRYWETEFSVLKPGKTPSRHRLYRRRDVETLLEIKHLLYEEGFTIAGAKKRIKDVERSEETALPLPEPSDKVLLPVVDHRALLRDIREEVLFLRAKLSEKIR
ncbi:MAG: MerR family transcriptional regulator [Deltaproteobacteria bacterium]|nr:MerR family transcriptional regulator [Deltaproteobacteria bacterium]